MKTMDAALERLGERLTDRQWRLANLYTIIGKDGRRMRFRPNWAQAEVFESLARRNVDLKVRQLGLTTGYCMLWLDACLVRAAQRLRAAGGGLLQEFRRRAAALCGGAGRVAAAARGGVRAARGAA